VEIIHLFVVILGSRIDVVFVFGRCFDRRCRQMMNSRIGSQLGSLMAIEKRGGEMPKFIGTIHEARHAFVFVQSHEGIYRKEKTPISEGLIIT
jgi:hypothetical protein